MSIFLPFKTPGDIVFYMYNKRRGGRGVGHDYMHNEALTKTILLNTALLTHRTNKPRYNDCAIITGDHCYCCCPSRDLYTLLSL